MSLHAHPSPSPLQLNDREQIQYLLGNPPSWMMRYGISMVFFCVGLLVALSYFVQYPDVIEAKITLTTANPPIRVVAQSGGPISELLCADHQPVEKGQVLAVIENTARWRDVVRLETWLQQDGGFQGPLLQDLQLGALQAAYSAFSQHWNDYQYFCANSGVAQRKRALGAQIAQLEKLNDNLGRQKAIFLEELALSAKERGRQKKLHAAKLISDSEYEKSESSWLQQKRQVEATEGAALQTLMQAQQLRNQIIELDLLKSDSHNDKSLALMEDIQRLRSAIAEWKQKHLVIAPISGKVSLTAIWSAQQNIASGAEILAIAPAAPAYENNRIVGKASVPGQDMGKLHLKNRAIVRLDAYPPQQFGTLEGEVANISAMPDQKGYLLDVSLPNNMTTAYNKDIPFRQEMEGQVRIVTAERRVIDRLFDRLRDLLKNQ